MRPIYLGSTKTFTTIDKHIPVLTYITLQSQVDPGQIFHITSNQKYHEAYPNYSVRQVCARRRWCEGRHQTSI